MFVPVAAEMCQLIAISCLLTQDMRYIMCFLFSLEEFRSLLLRLLMFCNINLSCTVVLPLFFFYKMIAGKSCSKTSGSVSVQ